MPDGSGHELLSLQHAIAEITAHSLSNYRYIVYDKPSDTMQLRYVSSNEAIRLPPITRRGNPTAGHVQIGHHRPAIPDSVAVHCAWLPTAQLNLAAIVSTEISCVYVMTEGLLSIKPSGVDIMLL